MTSEVAQESTTVVDHDRSVDPELVALARQAAGDGTVLLRNNGVLPLAPGRGVALFGRVQVDWIAVGYGSGGDVNAPYVTDLLGSLEDLGHVRLHGGLAETYRQWCRTTPPNEGFWGNWPRFHPEMPLEDSTIKAAAEEAEVAVVVIGRAAGEDRENTLEAGSYYLTADERSLLERVTAAFDETVVVVSTGNVMDLSWADELGVSALVLAWLGGMEGARAVADVLCGLVEPGGRLTDTIARRYEDYPTAANFGGLDHNNYAEDVFVGYRHFETFAPDAVQFPFGFGLGYTDFDITPREFRVDDEVVEVDVDVTCTGERAGRQVVQAYVQAPDGVLAKPARELVAFARTGRIEPGASEGLTLRFPLEWLASYDDGGATGIRSAWVLEAGEYVIHVGSDVRRTRVAGAHVVAELQVVEQLEEAAAPDPAHPFDRVTVERNASGTARIGWEPVPVATVDLRQRILDRLPDAVEPTGDRGHKLADVVGGKISLDEFIGQLGAEELASLAYGDVTMDSHLGTPGNAGAFGGVTEALRAKGVPPVVTTDGPSGIRVSAYASLLPCGVALASTWDRELVRSLAALHGGEMLAKGSDVLLSPGMNIHRDPLCGRNFEYFSEDPVVTGLIASDVVSGIQSRGVAACPKHFAANNQETNRTKNDSRVSERALREIYLRGFQLCVEFGRPQVIMTSYNKVNGVWAHYNYDLVTTILRGEWNYDGVIVTDWWMQPSPDPNFPDLEDSAYRVRAQVDVLMPGGVTSQSAGLDGAIVESLARPDGITLGEVQRSAKNVLRFVARSGRLERGPITPPPRQPEDLNAPLTADTRLGLWLDSPFGRPLILELLDRLGATEDHVFPVRSARISSLIPMSDGRITPEMLQEVVARAAEARASIE